MVKPLRLCIKCVKLTLLSVMFVVLAIGIWLHQAERSLNWAKPWIVSAMNPDAAPFRVEIGDVSIDWRDMAQLGKVRIAKMELFKRTDGGMFAQLPEMFVTIDPIGFFPRRHLLHTITIHAPKLFMMRGVTGTMQLGLEDSATPMPLASLFSSVTGDRADNPGGHGALPFHAFVMDNASLTFSDAVSGTQLVGSPVALQLKRTGGRYNANLSVPFDYEGVARKITAVLHTAKSGDAHILSIGIAKAPIKLLCVFGFCPDKVEGTGAVDGTIDLRIGDDGTLLGVAANMATPHAVLTAPEWFEKSLVVGASSITAHSDAAEHTIHLTGLKLQLEDTSITGTGSAHHGEEGWTVEADGQAGRLDITKVYKYWPLFMAKDSRLWVTSKLKNGYAEKATAHLSMKPEDFGKPSLPDKALDAWVDARGITFDYLEGFPPVENMDGLVHFTGETVKIDGSGGHLLKNIAISKATLLCLALNNPRNPMEAHVTLTTSAADAATMLALPLFTFDDSAQLNPAKITGAADVTMGLKFNAFPGDGAKDPNPNAVHLDAVDYNITAQLHDFAQHGFFGSYDAKSINGTLKADAQAWSFSGSLAVGDAGMSDLRVEQPSGKPIVATVKSHADAAQSKTANATNDFTVSYDSIPPVPTVALQGKRLDLTHAYGTGKGSVLHDFPALRLTTHLDEVLLAEGAPLTQAVGTLYCTAQRCESADFSAMAEKSSVKATISRIAGARQFLLTSGNAGSLFKAIGLTDRMTGGQLELRGTYDDTKTPPQLNAALKTQEFTLKNAQILGRIFSIGSLTGLANALTGSGIAFDKMLADIAERDGLITLAKGRANGNAMGITFGGTVDTDTQKLNLKGVVVPAYAINSILSKIPLIGALAGGEGEGLIAFNYSVHGTFDEPEVMVNPLSGLTPGFLRGIFGIFDRPVPAVEEDKNALPDPANFPPISQAGNAPPESTTPVPGSGRLRR